MLPDPPKVHAADDNTSKYLYVIGTIAAYGGINIDVNTVATRFPNFVDDVMALADEIYTEYASTKFGNLVATVLTSILIPP